MVIFKGSRYERVKTFQVTGPNGQPVTVLGIRYLTQPAAGFLHTFRAGERLDLLAYRFYRNPEKFWRIADANSEMDAEDLLDPGRKLSIPPDQT